MEVLVQQPDPTILGWLEDRRRNGLDRWDEVWEGVLHVVPPPGSAHQSTALELVLTLKEIVEAQGLRIFYETGLFATLDPLPGVSYRVPDVVVAHPRDVSERGIELRAELVIEVLSTDDKSRRKFAFYAARGVSEVWLVDPISRETEVHVLRDGHYTPQPVMADGTVVAPRFGLTLRVVGGPKLRVTSGDQSTDV